MKVLGYLDTNALVKLYVDEVGRDRVEKLIDEVEGALTTSVITYAESRGVFARYLREGKITAPEHNTIVENFNADWEGMNAIDVTPSVYRRAGDLLVAHPHLRAMDAIHMASVLDARTKIGIKFLTFDDALEAVATALLTKKELG
ncbi:type II toxin-antitoxin system VapC family toxin [Deinococcus sp. QL22]|uniref:type II toxin-antitoxin system VapC family toxin n=1 Tax=Deinococcus sp. QL22 TaxID=2939437 RepID=UPI002017C8C8|nr:type II toxin-antitoxin system VapC family toxin [Deinococcus sp. QL22]UQN09634.1 type II toxin-antitoxin system VapC family toxin [Deinococcus sp. QL22]